MIFLDTSALVKRYVDEPGSTIVVSLMNRDLDWSASALALTEASIAFCRGDGPTAESGSRQRQLLLDWDRFVVVPTDVECLSVAADIGCHHPVRTADAIHLAAALRLPGPVTFLSFDRRQSEVAAVVGLDVVPTVPPVP